MNFRCDIGEKLAIGLIDVLSEKVICISQAVQAKFAKFIPETKLVTVYG